jgi:arginyl-tRNA synthetase
LYLELEQQLTRRIGDLLKRQYGLQLPRLVVDQPPRVELGEYALPLSFELAKKLRKPPRRIAEDVVTALGQVPGFSKFEVAGAGYINARVDRRAAARMLLGEGARPDGEAPSAERVLVEHTSINPNKAAHIGHVRNSILGDTFVRLLRASGAQVDVQNYIDNTGVQVADVVVGFLYLEKKSQSDVQALVAHGFGGKPFDYYCWDLYARVSRWYEQDKEHLRLRLEALHDIERGGNPTAEMGKLISNAIIERHLETMQRLGIQYDFLPQESEILHLHFWSLAFAQLKDKGVVYFETEGKNKDCWVMKRAGSKASEATIEEQGDGTDEDTKVIVRSNGTVTYVGKDIAYHLWKFGLLGKDFGYRKFHCYPDGHQVWISAVSGEMDHPHFGGVHANYNVIDARQNDPQEVVVEALRALGYTEQAENCHHFSYGMVVLTPRSAMELGFQVPAEEQGRAFIELSGRKGFGIKADDMIDALITAARKEVDARHPEMPESERREIAAKIAVGALRYFMLKFTKGTVIAFDSKDALSFEGETGPYAQYAVVRATNIFRKAALSAEDILSGDVDLGFLDEDDEIWGLWLRAGQLSHAVQQSIATTEPAFAAKYAFQLAQQFNNFYHRHHILTETDEARRRFLLATVAVVRRSLIGCLGMMGITVPAVM